MSFNNFPDKGAQEEVAKYLDSFVGKKLRHDAYGQEIHNRSLGDGSLRRPIDREVLFYEVKSCYKISSDCWREFGNHENDFFIIHIPPRKVSEAIVIQKSKLIELGWYSISADGQWINLTQEALDTNNATRLSKWLKISFDLDI